MVFISIKLNMKALPGIYDGAFWKARSTKTVLF